MFAFLTGYALGMRAFDLEIDRIKTGVMERVDGGIKIFHIKPDIKVFGKREPVGDIEQTLNELEERQYGESTEQRADN